MNRFLIFAALIGVVGCSKNRAIREERHEVVLLETQGMSVAEKRVNNRIESLTPITRPPFRPLNPQTVRQLSSNDVDSLIELYRSSTNQEQKVALAWTLGFVGTRKATDALITQLTNDYAGTVFSSGAMDRGKDEEQAFFSAVKALGFAAAGDDTAYAVLREGVASEFWARTISWRSKRGEGTFDLLASSAIQGIGVSGRPEVPTLLQQLKQRVESAGALVARRRERNYAGDVVQAAFFDSVIRAKGADYMRENFFGDDRELLWKEWKTTSEGIAWFAWYEEAKRQR